MYKKSGNKKAEGRIHEALLKYDKEVEEFFSAADDDDMDLDMPDEGLPFL